MLIEKRIKPLLLNVQLDRFWVWTAHLNSIQMWQKQPVRRLKYWSTITLDLNCKTILNISCDSEFLMKLFVTRTHALILISQNYVRWKKKDSKLRLSGIFAQAAFTLFTLLLLLKSSWFLLFRKIKTDFELLKLNYRWYVKYVFR